MTGTGTCLRSRVPRKTCSALCRRGEPAGTRCELCLLCTCHSKVETCSDGAWSAVSVRAHARRRARGLRCPPANAAVTLWAVPSCILPDQVTGRQLTPRQRMFCPQAQVPTIAVCLAQVHARHRAAVAVAPAHARPRCRPREPGAEGCAG